MEFLTLLHALEAAQQEDPFCVTTGRRISRRRTQSVRDSIFGLLLFSSIYLAPADSSSLTAVPSSGKANIREVRRGQCAQSILFSCLLFS